MASSFFEMVMVIANLPGIHLSKPFFLLLPLPLFIFHGFLKESFFFFETVYYPAWWDHIICLFVVNPRNCHVFLSFCSPWRFIDQCIGDLFLSFPCRIFSILPGTVRSLLANSKSLPLFVMLVFSTSSVGTLRVYSCWKRFFFLEGGLFEPEYMYVIMA